MTSDYDSAVDAILQIADDGYRNAAIEAVILHRVRQEKGFNDPGGPLAQV